MNSADVPSSLGLNVCGVKFTAHHSERGTNGHALADLAPTGHSATEAAGRLSAAIAGHGPSFARALAPDATSPRGCGAGASSR